MKKCLNCSKEFKPSKHNLNQQKFCNKKCQYNFWSKNNKEKVKVYETGRRKEDNIKKSTKWRKKNPDKFKKIRKRYYLKHREEIIRKAILRHFLKLEISIAEWERIKKRYNYQCSICRKREPFIDQKITRLTIDHILPLSRGGGNELKNIQPLCHRCNAKKGNKIL